MTTDPARVPNNHAMPNTVTETNHHPDRVADAACLAETHGKKRRRHAQARGDHSCKISATSAEHECGQGESRPSVSKYICYNGFKLECTRTRNAASITRILLAESSTGDTVRRYHVGPPSKR